MIFLASACLCGKSCRYDGRNVPHPEIEKLYAQGVAIPVCPELLGGLFAPRSPCEIREGRVLNAEGADDTAAFHAGAAKTLQLAKDLGITRAVLKDKSPSCGSTRIYDGSFSGVTVPGQGVTAALLAANGLRLFTEESWQDVLCL
ncbi:MAG: hypothetical protein DELT_02272 [Desulfovibrio sp.]